MLSVATGCNMALEYNTVNAITTRTTDLTTGGPHYGLSASRKIVLSVGLLVALIDAALPAGLCLARSHQQTSNPPAARWKTFHDPRLRFEFNYPGDFKAHAHVSPQYGFLDGSVVEPHSRWGIYVWPADSTGLYATGPYAGMSLEQFAIARVKLNHGADGPDGTTYCTDVLRKKVVWNRSHLEVVEFFLTQVSEQYDPPSTTRKVIGPFCVVLLPGSSIKALVLELTGPAPPPRGSDELLKQIAESVRWAH